MSITPSGVVWRLLKKNQIWSRCTTSVTSVTHFFCKIARCSSCSVACFIRQLVSWWALTFESVHNIKWLWAQTTKIVVKESLENLLPCMRSIAPKFLRTPAVQIPYEMLCLHPLQLPCSVVDVSTSKKSTTAVQHHRGQGRCSRARRCCASSPWSFEKFCVTLTLTSNWWTQNPPTKDALFAYSCQHVCVWAFHSSEISAGRWSFGQMKSCHAVELMNCGKDRSPQPHTDVHSLREYANNVIFFFIC